MTHRFWPTWLGAFFFVGVVLFFLTILWYLPAGRYNVANPYVVYFQGSLAGLKVGSPVEYRGLGVGKVADVYLSYDNKSKKIIIPVIIHFLRRRDEVEDFPRIQLLIKQGMRARLVSDSLISSSSHINLFFSDEAPHYTTNLTKYKQIPVAVITEDAISIDEVLKSAKIAINNFNDSLGDALVSVNTTLSGVNDLLGGPVVAQLQHALKEIKDASYSLRVLLDYLARHPESLVIGKQGG